MLTGVFAFVLYDQRDGTTLIARDPLGIRALYWTPDSEEEFFVASEMKSIPTDDKSLKPEQFPPGQISINGQ